MPTTDRLLVDVQKSFGAFRLQVQLHLGTEILVLFGPSGAGKTQTLNAISGLVRPDRGEIRLDDQQLFLRRGRKISVDLPTRKRQIGYVFQDYALFPHLTAQQNVAYSLRHHPEPAVYAAEWLGRMRLSHLAERFPDELSGGQQQRVAIARALAARPQVLLMDEPFSALDLPVREKLQRDFRTLQRELGLIVIYVTHSMEDAVAMGDRLAVIQEGCVEQIGEVEEVLRRPANANAAEVLGIRNLFQAEVVESRLDRLALDWQGVRLEASPGEFKVGQVVTAYIRPEEIKILYPDRPLSDAVRFNCVTGQMIRQRIVPNGRLVQVRLDTAVGQELEIRFPAYAYASLKLAPGVQIQLSLRKDAIVVL